MHQHRQKNRKKKRFFAGKKKHISFRYIGTAGSATSTTSSSYLEKGCTYMMQICMCVCAQTAPHQNLQQSCIFTKFSRTSNSARPASCTNGRTSLGHTSTSSSHYTPLLSFLRMMSCVGRLLLKQCARHRRHATKRTSTRERTMEWLEVWIWLKRTIYIFPFRIAWSNVALT